MSLLLKIMEDNRPSTSSHSSSSSTTESSFVPPVDPCFVDDIVVLDYTTGFDETVALLEIVAHWKNMVQSILSSTQPASCMHLRFFPSLTPKFYNFCLYGPLIYKSYRKYSSVMSCTFTS
jgi:hypothetical protein